MNIERITPRWIFDLRPKDVAVGGGNLAGRLGKGFALLAKKRFGAKDGVVSGLVGQTYLIPTKDGRPKVDPFVRKSLQIRQIRTYVEEFLSFARENPHLRFRVTEVGCGLAGYKPREIAPLFREAVDLKNVTLPASFWEWINIHQLKK